MRLFLPLLVLGVILYSLIDCLQTPRREITTLPKLLWLCLIVLVPVVGAMAWILFGRPNSVVPRNPNSTLGWKWGGREPRRPSTIRPVNRGLKRKPIGPDDDPDFIAKIRNLDKSQEELLRRMEEDLRAQDNDRRDDDGDTPRS